MEPTTDKDQGKTEKLKAWTENVLSPLTLAGCLLGMMSGAVDAFAKAGEIYSSQRILAMVVLWIAVTLIVFRGVPSSFKFCGLQAKSIRFISLFLATCLLAFAAFWPQIHMHLLNDGPAKAPSLSPASQIVIVPKIYAAEKHHELKIERIYVNETLSSFEEKHEFDLTQPPFEKVRTFSYNERITPARQTGHCISDDGDGPIKEVLPLLKERADRIGRTDLALFVDNVDDYRRLMSRGGDRLSQLIFTQIELSRMRQSDPAAFKVVTRWLVDCVGVQDPVFTFEVRNRSSRAVLLDKLIYEVDKAFIVLGGDTGPLTPSVTYEHILPHRKGSFERALAPPFVIGPNAVGSFNVVVRSDEKGAGQTWLMRIALHDTGGDTVSTEEFQLIMSKRGF